MCGLPGEMTKPSLNLGHCREQPQADSSDGLVTSAILLVGLRKEFVGGWPRKRQVAVHNLSLAISRGECFGLLGPNGAGKTTTIRMLEGFAPISSGVAQIEGHSLQDDMTTIYKTLGTCPQENLLWGSLTGREHLLYYARLRGLQGQALEAAVTEGLQSVNLLADGAANKLTSSYSGGMKRRLSVAVALVGDPK
ncbi:hypothetical protein WJX84_001351, partial [Apatococcus fuscideae]